MSTPTPPATTTNPEDHPHHKRVKTWLWIHERYRNQAKDLQAMAMDNPSRLLAAFQKFHRKIESHSEFEDTQLFKFFRENKIGDQQALQQLAEQHKDIRKSDRVVEGLQKLIDGKEDEATYDKDVKPQLDDYVNDLLAHMELEEKTLVDPWLNLTFEEYRKYRTYLSWTYCFMY